MKPLFLIPARGGSKGVPGKNIRLLGGKPLISHTIEDALKVASDPEDVVVTTDSDEIAAIARQAGANVPFLRPAELATDTAGSREVIIHAADYLNDKGKDYDCIVLLQPTSPFRNITDIEDAMNLFEKHRPDMVVSVKEARSNPYYNAFEPDEDGFLKISKGDGKITRRQDAPDVFEFDGSIYVIDLSSLKKSGSIARIGRILPLKNTVANNIDIDSETDFLIAEKMISK